MLLQEGCRLPQTTSNETDLGMSGAYVLQVGQYLCLLHTRHFLS
jgi:hypothetical protein